MCKELRVQNILRLEDVQICNQIIKYNSYPDIPRHCYLSAKTYHSSCYKQILIFRF